MKYARFNFSTEKRITFGTVSQEKTRLFSAIGEK